MLRQTVMVTYLQLVIAIFSLLLTRSAGNVPSTEFFPFGVENGDINLRPSNLDDGSSNQLQLSIAFPFFNFLHDSLWVNINGAISFRSAISDYTPICHAVTQKYSMIAPYWSDVDLKWGGNVFYRETFEKKILQKAAGEIANAFPELKNIQLKWAFLTTWDSVSFYGAGDCRNRRKNTFQSILASDGVYSFAIFYYNNITWTTGTATSSGGNCSGLGGIPAKAGFDAGDGKALFTIPGSCSSDITSIGDRSNVGNSGKWVFRVDNTNIQPAGCSTNFTRNIRVVPTFIDMYGHVPVEIIGPCFNDSVQLACRFHDPIKGIVEVPGQGVGTQSNMSVVCIAPFLYGGGRISIDLVVTFNQTTQIYSGFLYVIAPQVSENRLVLTASGLSGDRLNIKFSWDPEHFSTVETLDLNLYIYDRTVPEWTMIKPLAKNIVNNGSLSKNFSKIDFTEKILKSACIFSVEPSPHKRAKRGLWQDFKNKVFSGLLNIYNFFSEDILGHGCMDWYKKDPGPPNDLIPCPPTATQFRADPRFGIDPECKSPPCIFHEEADFCIRSRNPSPSGGGQQCCYKGDNILLGPPGGGTVDKSHYKNGVLSFDHFVDDVLPWSLCCKDKPLDLCYRYYEKRPSDPGTGYVPPQPAGGRGDPHITTFDHLGYTFNGAGEFWLIKNGTDMPMAVQSRMESFTYPNGTGKSATVFTAFVMKAHNSSTVQVQRSLVRTVDIYIDGVLMDLSSPFLFDISYEGVQVSVAYDMSSVSVAFASGFNFHITTTADAFSIFTTCDKKYKNKTRGLLGVYDGDKNNDLQDQNGNVFAVNSSLQDIHYKFGLTWRILQSESLFTYIEKQYHDYNIPNFVPSFLQPDIKAAPQEVKDVCGDAIDCLYDYMTTGSATVANQTKASSSLFNENVQIYQKQVITCPPLTYPTNGYYQADNFMPGSVATYTCYSNHTLKGNPVIYCNGSGFWNGSAPACSGGSGNAGVKIGNVQKTVLVVVFTVSFTLFQVVV
jgi:hypothetical protein